MYANGYGRVLLDTPCDPSDRAITVSRNEGRVVLGYHGTLDRSTAPALREALLTELGRHPSTVVVDLSGLEHWNSCGMNALVTAHRSARRQGASVVVAGLRGRAAASYRATCLATLIPTCPDVAAAMAHRSAA
ncbi:STAS domain-containing protein [Kitasatospora paranensis]|uniref:STAS domain-containing protein n=1 Tax=Kitasatospora paranensis TaxID=258053 RepID=A0ABW2FR11_9ACTN